MNLMKLIPIALFATLAAACIEENPKAWELQENNQQNNTQNNNTQNNNTVVVNPDVELSGMFLSGHLGNYSSCPEEGYSGDSSARSAEPSEGAIAADCAEDSPNCGGFLNCEGAQLTIKLENRGTAAAEGLIITKLTLFNSEGLNMADLPLMEVVNAETNEPAPETLGAGESVTLRVTFQGPANPYEFLQDEDGNYRNSGSMQITVESTNHSSLLIKTGTLYTIDNIAT